MRLARSTRWTIPLLLALAAPAVAQDGPPSGPPPEVLERLDRVRMERMRAALELTEAETQALAERMRAHRGEMREAMEDQREAMARLRASLRAESVDQGAVAEALERLERRRDALAAARDRHREELGRSLTPEKRAKLMLFNERFDHRLRELMERRRAPGPDRSGVGRGPGAIDPPHPGPYRRGEAPPPAEEARILRERIERVEAELDRLRRRLDAIE